MYYPIFDAGFLGPSTLIAIVAIVHVLIAHFAVGAGIAIPWLEARALRRNDTLVAEFIHRYARFLILSAFVGGAVTGVGIWFVVGLVSPESISLLLHQFVWGWAAEWVLFAIEITSGYVYYFYWDKMHPQTHLKVGIIYAISAWLSLVVINGILSFMLTPGDWLATRSFWDGWLNPTFWPSLVLRTISALALAGIFVAVVANLDRRLDREQRRHIIHAGSVFLAPLALMIPVSIWYFAMSPRAAGDLALGEAVAMTMFFGFGIVASSLVGFYAYFGLIKNRRYVNMETALLLAAIALVATGSMEYVREGIRKPYIVYNYMYANGLTRDNVTQLNQAGFFAPPLRGGVVGWQVDPDTLSPTQRGELIYRVQCERCHAIDGYNAMRPLIASWTVEMIRDNTRLLHRLKPFMPPFAGTEDDLENLVAYLANLRSEEWLLLHQIADSAGVSP